MINDIKSVLKGHIKTFATDNVLKIFSEPPIVVCICNVSLDFG